MDTGKATVLTAEQEAELRVEILRYWEKQRGDGKYIYTGTQIADLLGFGVPGSKWQILPKEYIYFYASKFKLRRRRHFKGYLHKYKYGKQMEPIEVDTLIERIEKVPGDSFHHKRIRTFNALSFWTGLRQGEIRRLLANDFKVRKDSLVINAYRLKKGRGVSEDQRIYPLELRLGWLFVGEIVDWVKKFKEYEKPWNMSRTTALRYVKLLFPRGYPHYYRLNRITSMGSDSRFTLVEMMNWTGLSMTTLGFYLSRSRRFVSSTAEKMSQILNEESRNG